MSCAIFSLLASLYLVANFRHDLWFNECANCVHLTWVSDKTVQCEIYDSRNKAFLACFIPVLYGYWPQFSAFRSDEMTFYPDLNRRHDILRNSCSIINPSDPNWCGLDLNSSPPGENGRHFADDIFRRISWTKSFVFWLKFHWSLFLRVWMSMTRHWFR